jgi:hypothetical protein
VQEWEYLVIRVLPDGRWVGWENGVWRERPLAQAEAVAGGGLRTMSSEERMLRQLGAQGWELTGVVTSLKFNAYRMYFKRPARTPSGGLEHTRPDPVDIAAVTGAGYSLFDEARLPD